jgi:hypothetical protein
MDTIFNNAFLRAQVLNDELLLLFFERENERRQRAIAAGARGGRPKNPGIKPGVMRQEKERSKEKELLNTHSARERGKHCNVFIDDAYVAELTAEFGATFVNDCINQLSDKLVEGYKTVNHYVTLRRFCDRHKKYLAGKQTAIDKKPGNDFIKHNYDPAVIAGIGKNTNIEF